MSRGLTLGSSIHPPSQSRSGVRFTLYLPFLVQSNSNTSFKRGIRVTAELVNLDFWIIFTHLFALCVVARHRLGCFFELFHLFGLGKLANVVLLLLVVSE